MKKRLVLLLSMSLVVGALTACGSSNSGSDTATDSASATTESSVSDSASADAASVDEVPDGGYLKDITAADYVTLGEYKGVTVELESPTVTDEEVDTYITTAITSYADKVEVTDRAVQDGDTVNIDYVGKYADSGEEFDGGSAEGYDLTIGSGTFIDGFEDGLIGANTGDVLDLNLTFPENYGSSDLAGKDVIFTVTVNKITTAPELTDEYAASLGLEGVSTIDDLKEYTKDSILTNKQEDYEEEISDQAFETVFNSCIFTELPEAFLVRFTNQFNTYAETVASYYSSMYSSAVTADQIITMSMSQDGYSGDQASYVESLATDSAERYIMCQAIADLEGITVTDEEVTSGIEEQMASASASYSGVEDYMEQAGIDSEVYKESLLVQKVQELIAENANVVNTNADAATDASSEEVADAATDASSEEVADAATDASSEDEADAAADASSEEETDAATEASTEKAAN